MTQKVPLLNLQQQHQQLGSELEAVVLNVLRSGNYILGKYVQQLEEDVAQLCGTKYGIGVANGTDALVIALWALNIGPGDEVITTPFTFAATVEAITLRGATPVFVDVFENSFNIDVTQIERAITNKTKAIMPIHLYGQPADMDAVQQLCAEYDLKLIEDNAQGVGATYKGRPTGSFGDVGCISFYPTKNLGAAGDAGMIVTSDQSLRDRFKSLRAHGMKRRYYHDELGLNSRLDELQAAILSTKLPYLQAWTRRRQEIARKYTEKLEGCPAVILPQISLGKGFTSEGTLEHVWHQYTIRINDGQRSALTRSAVIDELATRGIGSMCYYPVPLHKQDAFSDLGYGHGQFPVSEMVADQVLSLPMYPELTDDQIDYVTTCLREIMQARFTVAIPSPVMPPVVNF